MVSKSKGRNTFSSAYLHCSTSSHGERERRGMGLMAIVGPQPFGWTTGSRLAWLVFRTQARLSSLVKGARAGFEKPGEPWPHRPLTPSLQSSLCPMRLQTLTGGRYICREPVAGFHYCISNPQHPGPHLPTPFLYTALPSSTSRRKQAFCATPRYATSIPTSLDSKLVRFA